MDGIKNFTLWTLGGAPGTAKPILHILQFLLFALAIHTCWTHINRGMGIGEGKGGGGGHRTPLLGDKSYVKCNITYKKKLFL